MLGSVGSDGDYDANVNPFYVMYELFCWNAHYRYVNRQRQDLSDYLRMTG